MSLWSTLSLPVTGLIAHYYAGELRRLTAGSRITLIFFRVPSDTRRLVAIRPALIAEIESLRQEYRPKLQPDFH